MRLFLLVVLPLIGTVLHTAHLMQLVERWDPVFTVYWNVPSFQCASNQVFFADLLQKYGIVNNANDSFRGDKLAILYDPGNFPAILNVDGTDQYYLRNGGLPQDGNLSWHLDVFAQRLDELIPQRDFAGVGIVDFESWRPIFRQNFGALVPYKTLSIDRERQRHPSWKEARVKQEAKVRFEHAAPPYMVRTLRLAQSMRPNANWGYYAYPYCFNMSPNNMRTECAPEAVIENNSMDWLFGETDILFPSLYFSETRMNEQQRLEMMEGRIAESKRIMARIGNGRKIIPYFWYKFQDTRKFLSQEDLRQAFIVLTSHKLDGVIIWGSSDDVNSKRKCLDLYDYINKTLGPIVAAFKN